MDDRAQRLLRYLLGEGIFQLGLKPDQRRAVTRPLGKSRFPNPLIDCGLPLRYPVAKTLVAL
jgi:hypothetical protein